jgi:hypothetical protein
LSAVVFYGLQATRCTIPTYLREVLFKEGEGGRSPTAKKRVIFQFIPSMVITSTVDCGFSLYLLTNGSADSNAGETLLVILRLLSVVSLVATLFFVK